MNGKMRKKWWKISCTLVLLATAFFAPARAWAKTETIKYKGQDIIVTGDFDYAENVGDDGDLVIRWLSGTGTLEVPYKFEARALVVGGGGSGGSNDGANDVGPGGGGGEVFELEKKGAEIRALFAF